MSERDLSEQHVWNASTASKGVPSTRQPTGGRPLTAMERRAGARCVAAWAADAGELRELLALAGLTAADGLIPLEVS